MAVLLEAHNLVVREPGTGKNDVAAAALLMAAAAILLTATTNLKGVRPSLRFGVRPRL